MISSLKMNENPKLIQISALRINSDFRLIRDRALVGFIFFMNLSDYFYENVQFHASKRLENIF